MTPDTTAGDVSIFVDLASRAWIIPVLRTQSA